jgi:hypothetical protein
MEDAEINNSHFRLYNSCCGRIIRTSPPEVQATRGAMLGKEFGIRNANAIFCDPP